MTNMHVLVKVCQIVMHEVFNAITSITSCVVLRKTKKGQEMDFCTPPLVLPSMEVPVQESCNL